MKTRRAYIALVLVFFALWLAENIGKMILNHPEGMGFALASGLYPSLLTKMEVLGKETILAILSQPKWRWLILVLVGYYLFHNKDSKSESSHRVIHISLLIKLLILTQFLYLPDLYAELILRYQWRAFYEPIALWIFILPVFPPLWIIQVLMAVIAGSALFIFLQPKKSLRWKRVGAWIIPLSWTLLLAIFFGFGKIDHTYTTLYLGLWCLPILVLAETRESQAYFSIRFLQACIWGPYFFAGLEKLLLSGPSWFQPIHFQQLSFLHPTPINQWILQVPGLGSGILICGWVFQLTSALQWYFPKWGYINQVGGLMFHLGTWILFGIGGWQSPWIVMLIFLWPGWLSGTNKDVANG